MTKYLKHHIIQYAWVYIEIQFWMISRSVIIPFLSNNLLQKSLMFPMKFPSFFVTKHFSRVFSCRCALWLYLTPYNFSCFRPSSSSASSVLASIRLRRRLLLCGSVIFQPEKGLAYALWCGSRLPQKQPHQPLSPLPCPAPTPPPPCSLALICRPAVVCVCEIWGLSKFAF